MKIIDLNDKKVIINRTDSIGDVLLTLPICAWIREKYPRAEIIFLGRNYTRPVIESYECVDGFLDWAEMENMPRADKKTMFRELNADVIIHVFPNKEIAALAKTVRIPVRVGTSHRMYHLLTCTHRLDFTRRKSELHEAQLNHELLRPFGLEQIPSMDEIEKTTGFLKVPDVDLPDGIERIEENQRIVLLHPKSQGSAVEWPVENYIQLAEKLVDKGYWVMFTGTESEGKQFRKMLPEHTGITDTTGKLTLEQLMKLISQSDALVACSTGPFHIAGFYDIQAIGLFSPRKPIHPGRWRALGDNVTTLVFDPECPECAAGKECDCLTRVTVEQVFEQIA